ncbi:hypothetical protein L1887_03272 [Cichorium endivia]|nr:hypothetical protein L1887_03272 [Cichorium endivia]
MSDSVRVRPFDRQKKALTRFVATGVLTTSDSTPAYHRRQPDLPPSSVPPPSTASVTKVDTKHQSSFKNHQSIRPSSHQIVDRDGKSALLISYTSLGIEIKCMKRWEFDSIAQAVKCINSWFPGTPHERSILEEHLNSMLVQCCFELEPSTVTGAPPNYYHHPVALQKVFITAPVIVGFLVMIAYLSLTDPNAAI